MQTVRYMGLQSAMSSTAPISLPGSHLQSMLSSSAGAPGEMCGRLPGLVLQQLDVCRRNPLAMPCVWLGARLGLFECQYQFQYERWNCSPVSDFTSEAEDEDALQTSNFTTSVDTLIQKGDATKNVRSNTYQIHIRTANLWKNLHPVSTVAYM